MKAKNFSIITTLLIISIFSIHAQIKIVSDNVGIGITNPASKLSVGGAGNQYSTVYIYNSEDGNSHRGLQVYKKKGASTYTYGIFSSIEYGYSQGTVQMGICGTGYRGSTPFTNGQSCGVQGQAGNATSGWNYGVWGQLVGSNNGAAIIGTVPGKNPTNTYGMYAGYFRGNVLMEDDLEVQGEIHETSDMKLKKDVRVLESDNIEKLKQLQAIKYKLKTPIELNLFTKEVTDTATVLMSEAELNSPKYKKDRIGLSAQDIQKVFPEIVKENNNGYLSVNYIALIPVLVEAIKEQQIKIEELEKEVAKLTGIKPK